MVVVRNRGVLIGLALMVSAFSAQARDTSEAEVTELKFAPSYITIEGHKDVTTDDWEDPRVCAQCHIRQYEGWKGSMHANAFKDPVFQALWAMGEKATGGKIRNHCSSCHSPIGTVTDTIEFNPDKGLYGEFTAPEVASMGVSCDVCHTISGTNINKTAVLEHGNASFVMSPGPVKRATLKDAESPYHETEYSEHHASSQFCGNCHNIFHPDNNFPIERTYDEWKYSIYAQNDIQCMDCHMVPVDVAMMVADTLKRPHELPDADIGGIAGLTGPYREIVHDHAFVGGNAVVTAAISGEKSVNYNEAIKRLQNVASLDVSVEPDRGSLHKLKVKVTNERAGHNLPTSLTEVRQIWLEVIVTDDSGHELLRSGTLDEHSALPGDTVIFNAVAVDKNGRHTAFPWEITRFTETNTIPPKGFRYGIYAFNIPEGAESINVVAKLHYRSFSQSLADLLLGKGKIDVPAVEMNNYEHSYKVADIKAPADDDDHH